MNDKGDRRFILGFTPMTHNQYPTNLVMKMFLNSIL